MFRHVFSSALWLLVLLQGSARAEHKPVVVVFEIAAKGFRLKPSLRSSLTSYLATKLTETGLYEVVPQDKLKEALVAKKKESYRQCYDQSCQIEIGREMAASKSLASQIMKLGGKCVVTSDLYDLRRATSERAASSKGRCSEEGLIATIEDVVNKLTALSLTTVTPTSKPPAPWSAQTPTAAPPASPGASTPIYFVDIGAAMAATSQGKKAQQELKRLFDTYQAELHAGEAELKAMAAAKTAEAKQRLDDKLKALQQLYLTRQQQLAEREKALTASIPKGLRALLDHNKGNQRGMILELAHYSSLLPEWAAKTCDRSLWLAASYDRGSLLPIQHEARCQFRGAMYVEWGKVFGQTKQGQAIKEQLHRKYRELQAGLDKDQQQMRALRAAGKTVQAERAAAEFQQKFVKFDKELKDLTAHQERELDQRLSRQLRAVLAKAGLSTTLFLKAQPGAALPVPVRPSCDVTAWAIRLLDGQAAPDELKRSCPALVQ